MITAPFNFVPLSKDVFFPSWSENVSHDIPFEDSVSGMLDITITAKSPIFVRDHEKGEHFCQHNSDYYIPSTSVKGMIRNVLEIMSFSKMSQLNDDTYAVRDLSDNSNFYMKEMKKDTFCGWLKKVGNDFIIEDCGKPGRIKHEEIDKIFNIDFASKFKKGKFGNKADDKTARKKYKLINNDNFTYTFSHTSTSTVGDKRYSYDTSSPVKGTIVLTGQPSGRDENAKIPNGKVYEFIFFDVKKEMKLTEKSMQNFLFAYFDGRDTEPKESPDWTFWKEKLYRGEKIPVFFQKSENTIAHFGLSYLYKLPYKHSVKDGLSALHFDTRADLAQTIFGYVNKKKALKGRVNFSHFKATKNVQELEQRTEILGTPRASYYPIYVKQNDKLFTTFMDEFSIAGWKRYPVHKGAKTSKTEDTGNEKVGTTFVPLKEGAVFQGKLRYHNLKKAELGAVLSALTFHNTANCFHNIGMAKALGYGKIKVDILGVDHIEEYLKAFEFEMDINVSNWIESEQLQELLTMATEQNNTNNSILEYMSLPNFGENKTGSKDCLRSYSTLSNINTISVKPLVSQEELEVLKLLRQEREAQEKADMKLKEEFLIAVNSNNLQILQNFKNKYPDYDNISQINTHINEIEILEAESKHAKVNETAQNSWDGMHNPKYKNKLKKSLQDFVKKWEAKKNNKGSTYVLELVEQAKRALH